MSGVGEVRTAQPADIVIREVRTVQLADIIIGERMRVVNEALVQRLMVSIAQIGLLQSIGITPHNVLVYGFHRLEAMKRLGLRSTEASIREAADDDEERLRDEEWAENDVRADMTWSEKAAYFGAVEEIAKGEARGRVLEASNRGYETMQARAEGIETVRDELVVSGAGRARQVASARSGINYKSIEKVRFMQEVAADSKLPEGVREAAAEAIAAADKTGRLDPQYQTVKRVVEAAKAPVMARQFTEDAVISQRFTSLCLKFGEGLEAYDAAILGRVLDQYALQGLKNLHEEIGTLLAAIASERRSDA